MRKRKTDLAYGRLGVTEWQRSIKSLVRSLFCACERTMRPLCPTTSASLGGTEQESKVNLVRTESRYSRNRYEGSNSHY